MKLLRCTALLILIPAIAYGEKVEFQSKSLIESSSFDNARIESELVQRVKAGVYEGYQAELCIDAPSRCKSAVFEPYKKVKQGQTTYLLTIERTAWDGLPAEIREEAIREIIYNTWGSINQPYSPLEVAIKGAPVEGSPLSYLSSSSADRYLHFAAPGYLNGGVGTKAYGPNCWYSSISAIVDPSSAYARSKMIALSPWQHPRFMGPSEFRSHMKNFTEVSTPRFGDIIRYYTEAPIYGGYKNLVYGGEVHAAVYIGSETYLDTGGNKVVRDIALTKNGRSDFNFLVFQDVRGLDIEYLAPTDNQSPAPDVSQQIKKGYFRVKSGITLLDPATAGRVAQAYESYLVDIKNYADRWLCLSNLISPPAGNSKGCMDYPANWLTIEQDNSATSIQPAENLNRRTTQRGRQQPRIEHSSSQNLLEIEHDG
ncbi:hypothetical protein [Pseudomonas putida]|jgi:hypothetical protein|uniref:hypothetical protein n=1 Tax=Pseudomonas putida TaxID=303 RepID=UPI00117B9472|nr:hypothetical protein [Pseudomonas putida]